jgi:Fanconi anemia group M protein
MIDGYLFAQLKKLKTYQNPILVIEGDGLFATRNISDDAIFGALSAVTLGLGISIITCKDSMETARFLLAGAKKERKKGQPIKLRAGKSAMILSEQQRYIAEGLPNISAKLAQRLLSHFKTVRAIFTATEKELVQVSGVGKTIAKAIRKAIDEEYKL